MLSGFRRRMGSGRPRRQRSRLAGCLLWLLALIVALVILSLLFGGFQKGTRAGGDGAPVPFPVTAAGPGGGH
jgi:hypothetical protein